jgi:hypothetical protein
LLLAGVVVSSELLETLESYEFIESELIFVILLERSYLFAYGVLLNMEKKVKNAIGDAVV